MAEVNCALNLHIERLLPQELHAIVLHKISWAEICALSPTLAREDLNSLGITEVHLASSGDADKKQFGNKCISVRSLVFKHPKQQFMTRFLPYTASMHVVSLRKRNLSVDDYEGFVAQEETTRSHNITSSVNAAYFLHDRCAVCGAEVDHDKKQHKCDFFCVAACVQEKTNATKMVLAYVEFNLLAAARPSTEKCVPCVSIHVFSPSQVVAACLSVVDALDLLMRSCLESTGNNSWSCETAVPCPAMLFQDMRSIDVSSLYTIVSFYIKNVVPTAFGIRVKAAMWRVLLEVGEYVLRTSVPKPMMVPFVPVAERDYSTSTSRHCVHVPMRQILQSLQMSKLKLPHTAAMFQSVLQPEVAVEKRQFLQFLSLFSVCEDDLIDVFGNWTHERFAPAKCSQIQRSFAARSRAQGNDNRKLKEFLFAVRCFFHANQQSYFREDLQIMDFGSLGQEEQENLELRFLLLLFRKGVSRRLVHFDNNDVCDVICLSR